MSDINASYQGTTPQFYHRHLGPVISWPHAQVRSNRFFHPGLRQRRAATSQDF